MSSHPKPRTSGSGQDRILAKNKRARYNFQIFETLEVGLVLVGTEVKAIREGQIQLKDAYVEFRDGEAYLSRAHVGPYSHGNRQNHEVERSRKLLLKKHELHRLFGRVRNRGLTIVPLEVRLRNGWIKVVIGLAQGKKLHDKRQAEKQKELDREAREAMGQRRW